MNLTVIRFISLFLVFSLFTMSCSVLDMIEIGRGKKGFKLIVAKTDDQRVNGKLIAVKQKSLLILDSESKADISIDISAIKEITIVNMTTPQRIAFPLILAAGGAGIAVTLWALISLFSLKGLDEEEQEKNWKKYAMYGALISGIIAIGAVMTVKDEVIQIEGMTDSEIQDTLDKLRKKARIRNYK